MGGHMSCISLKTMSPACHMYNASICVCVFMHPCVRLLHKAHSNQEIHDVSLSHVFQETHDVSLSHVFQEIHDVSLSHVSLPELDYYNCGCDRET